jgi:hypothetical protein
MFSWCRHHPPFRGSCLVLPSAELEKCAACELLLPFLSQCPFNGHGLVTEMNQFVSPSGVIVVVVVVVVVGGSGGGGGGVAWHPA